MDTSEIIMVNNELSETLQEEYDMRITLFEGNIDKMSADLIPIPSEIASELSVISSSLPDIITNYAVSKSLDKTAYSITFNGESILSGRLWEKKNGSYISN